MRLGNSNGSNMGLKYLNNRDAVEYVYANKADEFNRWMSDNHKSLVKTLTHQNIYNDDVFNQTYELVYNRLLYKQFEGDVSKMKGYFMRSYYTNNIQKAIVESNRKTEEITDNIASSCTVSIEDVEDKESACLVVEKAILNYVYANYSTQEFEIFNMYCNLKPAVSYKALATIIQQPYYKVRDAVCKIKKSLLNQPDIINMVQNCGYKIK